MPRRALPFAADLHVEQDHGVPSQQLTLDDIVLLARRIEGLARDRGRTGVVVTMGTDMLEEVAFALDLLRPSGATVVVTGALRAPQAPGSDGESNLRAALLVAGDRRTDDMGCLVVMNDEVHSAWQVTKQTSRPDGFASVVSGPVGSLSEDIVRLVAGPIRRPRIDAGTIAEVPPVALVRAGVGDDGRLLDAVRETGYRGLIVEASGGGSVPSRWSAPLRRLSHSMPIVYTRRTGHAATLQSTYGGTGGELDLRSAGLVPAGFLDGPKARVLLSLLLAAGAPADALRAAFTTFDHPAPA